MIHKMTTPKISTGEMIEIQLQKWMTRGHLHNVILKPKRSHPSLPKDEILVAEVIDRSGQSYFFTNNGFTLPRKGFVSYQEIKAVKWISFKPDRFKRKAEDFDHIEFLFLDGSQIALTDVEQAVFPLLKFFEWTLEKRTRAT
jgi:hypothetical protein